MKIIVFSDSHGDAENMQAVLSLHRSADAVFHLGDGTREFLFLQKDFPGIPFLHVPGNYEDPYGASPLCCICTELGGKRILLTHGHKYEVKGGTAELIAEAKYRHADIALFGHTHEQYCEYIPPEENGDIPLYLFNPGSIGRARYGEDGFGVIEIRGKDVLLSHGKMSDVRKQ